MRDGYVLLIEDNPDDEVLTMRALQKSGVRNDIRVARDGVEALEALLGGDAGASPLPVLILLDMKLPCVDGVEILRRIRADQRTALVPAIVLTSSSSPEDMAASYRSGANAYVRKPIQFDEFVKAVDAICRFWLLVNEPPPISSEIRSAD